MTRILTIKTTKNLFKETDSMYTIGIDLGGTNIAVGIFNENKES